MNNKTKKIKSFFTKDNTLVLVLCTIILLSGFYVLTNSSVVQHVSSGQAYNMLSYQNLDSEKSIMVVPTDKKNLTKFYGATTVTELGDFYYLTYESSKECEKAYDAYTKAGYIVEYNTPVESMSNQDATIINTEYAEKTNNDISVNDVVSSDKKELSLTYLDSDDVVVAVIDSGVNLSSNLLKNRVVNYDSAVDKFFIVEESLQSGTYNDETGHGTTISEIIISESANNIFIYPYKVFDETGYTTVGQVYNALMACQYDDIDVVNLSMSYKGKSPMLEYAINQLHDSGKSVIVSAGNNGDVACDYMPGNIDNAINIGAVNADTTITDYSNTGDCIDYVALGSYGKAEGTSMSTAYVSAYAAIVAGFEQKNNIDVDTDKIFDAAAIDLGEQGFDNDYGYGYLTRQAVINELNYYLENGLYNGVITPIKKTCNNNSEVSEMTAYVDMKQQLGQSAQIRTFYFKINPNGGKVTYNVFYACDDYLGDTLSLDSFNNNTMFDFSGKCPKCGKSAPFSANPSGANETTETTTFTLHGDFADHTPFVRVFVAGAPEYQTFKELKEVANGTTYDMWTLDLGDYLISDCGLYIGNWVQQQAEGKKPTARPDGDTTEYKVNYRNAELIAFYANWDGKDTHWDYNKSDVQPDKLFGLSWNGKEHYTDTITKDSTSINPWNISTLGYSRYGYYTNSTDTYIFSDVNGKDAFIHEDNATTDQLNKLKALIRTSGADVTCVFRPNWLLKSVDVKFHINHPSSPGGTVTETFTFGTPNQKFGYNTDGTGRYGNMSGQFGLWDITGYTLLGWADSATATSKDYNIYSEVADFWIDKNHPSKNLYAVWKPKTAKVTFAKNDGSGDTVTETFTYDVSNQKFGYNTDGTCKYPMTGQFGAWDRTGYTLLGWSTSATATTATYSVYSGVTNDWINSNTSGVTLYAVWKPNTYTIKYDANFISKTPNNIYGDAFTTDPDSSITVASTTATYDSSVTLAENKFTREGYTFKGWSIYPNWKFGDSANRLFASGATITPSKTSKNFVGSDYYGGFKATQGDTVTLYAIWEPIKYTVTYHSNDDSLGNWNEVDTYYQNTDGTRSDSKVNIRYDQDFKIAPLGFSRTASSSNPFELSNNYKLSAGYNFIGWSISPTSIANAKNTHWGPQSGNTTSVITFNGSTSSGNTSVRNLTKTNDDNIDLYATWSKPIILTFNLNNHTGATTKYKGNNTDTIVLKSTIYNSQYYYTFDLMDNLTAKKDNYYKKQNGCITAYGNLHSNGNGTNTQYIKYDNDGNNYRLLGWSTTKYDKSQAHIPMSTLDVYANGEFKSEYNTRKSNLSIYDSLTLYACWEPVLEVSVSTDRIAGTLSTKLDEYSSINEVTHVNTDTESERESTAVILYIKPGEQAKYSIKTNSTSGLTPYNKKITVTFDENITKSYTSEAGIWNDNLNRYTGGAEEFTGKHSLNRIINPAKHVESRKFYIPMYLGTENSYYGDPGVNMKVPSYKNTDIKVEQYSYFYNKYKDTNEQVIIGLDIYISRSLIDIGKEEQPVFPSTLKDLKARLKLKLNK